MIEIQHGDLLRAPAEALVNTVNCVGVMGKGIALQFERAFPENARRYKAACKEKSLRPGDLLITELQLELENQIPRFIVNFATKDHWKAPSRLEWIASGLQTLRGEVKARGIASIAVPPLGCGLGGLNWEQVRPLIEGAFADLPDVHVLLFAPEGSPEAATMAPPTQAPNMTPLAALTIELLDTYSWLEEEFSQLEIQKLTYFLQQAGEPMSQTRFEKRQYGPAAEAVWHQLSNWENHWIVGFGDGTSGAHAAMMLRPEAVEGAREYRAAHPNSQSDAHLARVLELIEGLDTAFGLELLSSVHWAARHEPLAARDVNEAARYVHAWNERKRALFSPEHIALAWNQLSEKGWLKNLRPEWMRPFTVENKDVDAITYYVNGFEDLPELLLEAAHQAGKSFSSPTLHLELWHDPEATRDALSLQIGTTLSPALRAAQLESFDHAWWLERAARWQGILGIELI